MKKIIIVGGGISSLTAGIYAAQSGFDVEILEQHSISGGFCTSWRRKGYLFEGGLHWLTGSSDKHPLHKIWREIGAIDDDTKIYRRDPFLIYDHFGQKVMLYRDLEKLRAHLIEISPDDKREINIFCKNLKRFSKVTMPLVDIKGLKVKEKSRIKLSSLFAMLPALIRLNKYSNMSAEELGMRFRSEAISAFIKNMIGDYYNAMSILFSFGSFMTGDGGFLEGGSLRMTQKITNRFISLGGRIRYKAEVKEVIVKDGKAVGVELLDNEKVFADGVIVTTDTAVAIDRFFKEPLNELWTDKMRALKFKSMINTFVCIGVEVDLADVPEYVTYALDEPFEYAGQSYNAFGYEHYAHYDGFAPKGCTAITVTLMGDTWEFWKAHKDAGRYESEKEKLGRLVIELLEKRLPQIKDKVAVVDVATPLTYERYTGSYNGAWMTKVGKGDKMMQFPSKSETISNLYFAGHRIQPPGGLPVAAYTGRQAIQHLCKDNDVIFQGNACSNI